MGKLFGFPNPVNEVAARTVASGVLVMAFVALITRQLWITIPLAYGFVARVLTGPKLSPLGRFATSVVAPRLSEHARFVAGPPKRFSQGLGAAMTLSALGCWLAGVSSVTYILLGLLIIPATLEAFFGLCVGCVLFGILIRAGLVPEAVCEACGDLYGPAATARRRAVARREAASQA